MAEGWKGVTRWLGCHWAQCDSMGWEESTPRTGRVSWDEAICGRAEPAPSAGIKAGPTGWTRHAERTQKDTWKLGLPFLGEWKPQGWEGLPINSLRRRKEVAHVEQQNKTDEVGQWGQKNRGAASHWHSLRGLQAQDEPIGVALNMSYQAYLVKWTKPVFQTMPLSGCYSYHF